MNCVCIMTRSIADSRVVWFALCSRIVISLVATCTALLVPPYDTSSLLQSRYSVLAAFTNWDGVYFAEIARVGGYEYEHFHAFFPLYPWLIRITSSFLKPLGLGREIAVPVAGWLVSNVSFVLSALFLYRLGCLVHQEPIARRAAYLFCIAPSSIFMSAIYTESLMCFLSFSGMYYLEKSRQGTTRSFSLLVLATFLFGLASITRSNGVLLSLYVAWYRLLDSPSPFQFPRFLMYWAITAGLGLIAIGPQVLYFMNAIQVYCPSLMTPSWPSWSSASSHIAVNRPWCKDVVPNVTAMYIFIQREYWDVGWLRYYVWKQVPNFLLASPMIGICIIGIVQFVQERKRMAMVTPYFIHWTFLFLNAMAVVHIQVITRLLAACPPVYWTAALWMTPSPSLMGRLVVSYSLLYYVLGAGLFSSFYPWT